MRPTHDTFALTVSCLGCGKNVVLFCSMEDAPDDQVWTCPWAGCGRSQSSTLKTAILEARCERRNEPDGRLGDILTSDLRD